MEKEITWASPEYHYYEKDARWHWIMRGGVVVLVIFAIWQKNFLFAVFMVIAGFLMTSWGEREPETVTFSLTEKELVLHGKKTYPYEKLSGFVIIEHPGHPLELVLRTHERLRPWMHIILPENMAQKIHAFLSTHLSEIEYEESMSERLGRILKF